MDALLGTGVTLTRRPLGERSTLRIREGEVGWLLCDERDVPLCTPLREAEQVAQFLEWQAYSAAIRHADAPLTLHAGAVARRGAAVLLPNVSGSGKTTLTLALAARRWLPLTDDVCPLVERDGELVAVGCRRSCHLRRPSPELLAQLGVEVEGPLGGLNYFYRPRRWGRPAPVKAVLFPRYVQDEPTSLLPLTQAECLARLATLHFEEGPVSAYQQRLTAARLAGRVPAYQLTYSSLDEALDRFGILEAEILRSKAAGKQGARVSSPDNHARY
jgi:hypothetical protein